MFYSTKRQSFLIDQGYAFKVVTNLLDAAAGNALHYATPQAQRELLEKVLRASEADAGLEADAPEVEGVGGAGRKGGRGPARRTGNMGDLTGGEGMMYMEVGGGKRKPSEAVAKVRRLIGM